MGFISINFSVGLFEHLIGKRFEKIWFEVRKNIF